MGRWEDDELREGEIKSLFRKYSEWLDKNTGETPFQNLISFSAQLTPLEAKVLSEVLFEMRNRKKV